MGNFVYNIALGRVAELYNRVDTNDPAASTLVIAILAATGIESDAVLKDKDTFAAVISGATDEVNNTNYARIVLTDADIAAFAPDDGSDRVDLVIADQTFTGIAAGAGWQDVVICYDPSSSGVTDAVMVPLTQHDFVVTPDGSDITIDVPATGFFRAS